ncbi:Multiple RNA-binding domain-containing protein 1 [Zancudomyces culisetae]|uniref:Multiple RNA-binding domain-containing protein 1 n=2 Tax=Zancudomyces culisetae TaxID=1213189 RepID=A0A1R1PCS5_ZANCU|nr:Multiple RNA-binding domain-containing protein 1 [Zancudomyces culisetae]|eukprot:OMH78652.1 Multiple RNA-binding domain-containing protein 1 [Zancudomyces culisetae]
MSSNEFNWNSLYMSADAIAESISERLKIDKSDILMNKAAGGGMNDDNDGDEADGSERAKGGMSAAVKLAIAETHIVESSKKYFEDNGIELKNFQNSKNKKRSNKVILVKNIGFNKNTEEQVEAIRDMFSAHGSLGRVLVPPMAGTIAIVEFLESNEAKSAFKYLAYKRVGDKPLYLEWAPENLFSHEYTPVGKAAGQKSNEDADAEAGNVDNSKNDDDNDMADAASNVIFIKNINFDSKKSTIEKLFKPFDGFQAISIRKGFGFAEFSNPKVAKRALKKLSKEELKIDGHKLQLQLSKTSNTKNNEDAKEETDNEKAISNRLIVKNIPFEATKKDITQLFQTFGQLKKVRLPKRPSYNSSNSSGYTHRGFAFLEFLTKNEALKAFNSTSDSTHLYGRRLVVEWTTAEGENENQMDIDANDKVDFQTEDAHINKKLKIKD